MSEIEQVVFVKQELLLQLVLSVWLRYLVKTDRSCYISSRDLQVLLSDVGGVPNERKRLMTLKFAIFGRVSLLLLLVVLPNGDLVLSSVPDHKFFDHRVAEDDEEGRALLVTRDDADSGDLV